MPLSALLILLASAVLHSIWNLLVKRSFDKQVFLWLAVVVSALMLLPGLFWFGQPISTIGWLILIGSAVLEVLYYLLLGAAYQSGDLSLVYPVTRGSVPLFVTILAVIFLGETVTPLGVAGIALTIAGIYVLHLKSLHRQDFWMPLRAFAGRNFLISLLTAISTALYTVVDKVGVTYANPTAYITWLFLLCGVMLAPFMLISPQSACHHRSQGQPRHPPHRRRAVCRLVLAGLAGLDTQQSQLFVQRARHLHRLRRDHRRGGAARGHGPHQTARRWHHLRRYDLHRIGMRSDERRAGSHRSLLTAQ